MVRLSFTLLHTELMHWARFQNKRVLSVTTLWLWVFTYLCTNSQDINNFRPSEKATTLPNHSTPILDQAQAQEFPKRALVAIIVNFRTQRIYAVFHLGSKKVSSRSHSAKSLIVGLKEMLKGSRKLNSWHTTRWAFDSLNSKQQWIVGQSYQRTSMGSYIYRPQRIFLKNLLNAHHYAIKIKTKYQLFK